MTKTIVMKINHYITIIEKPFDNGIARLFSMLLALSLSALLLVNPNHIADSAAALDHGYLTLLMLALSGGFIHGIGFKPIFWLWRILFSVYFSWTILLLFVTSLFM